MEIARISKQWKFLPVRYPYGSLRTHFKPARCSWSEHIPPFTPIEKITNKNEKWKKRRYSMNPKTMAIPSIMRPSPVSVAFRIRKRVNPPPPGDGGGRGSQNCVDRKWVAIIGRWTHSIKERSTGPVTGETPLPGFDEIIGLLLTAKIRTWNSEFD